MSTAPDASVWTHTKPFVVGAIAACSATCVVQPADLIKVRMQATTTKITPGQMFLQVIRSEGALALYKGLDCALFRQITYGTTRLGIHRMLTDRISERGTRALGVADRLTIAISAGGIGALVGLPADVALIRKQSDELLPVNERR